MMNKCLLVLLATVIFIFPPNSLWAQNPIPNPGFENWTGNTPDGWLPNNPPIGPQPVTPSGDAHSGTQSARLEVVEASGFAFPPLLSAGLGGGGFAVSQRHTTLSGYYKFSPQPDDVFTVVVQMNQGATVIGSGLTTINTASPNWSQFSVPITYNGSGTPDLCIILIQVTINQSIGGVAYVDDLQFGGVTSIETDDNELIPSEFELQQNYPNPFNPSTTIKFNIPHQSDVRLELFDVVGQKVATLISDNLFAGSYSYTWSRPAGLASGVYVYRLQTSDFVATRKMILTQ
jgi:hypothetical protein